jgi:hypothetical protein
MNINDCARQGDVLIRRVAELPENLTQIAPEGKGLVLAHGEATGHAHVVNPELATLYRNGEARMFLNVALAGCFVTHDEHAAIAIEPGTYEVIRQREYSPWDHEVRFVAD